MIRTTTIAAAALALAGCSQAERAPDRAEGADRAESASPTGEPSATAAPAASPAVADDDNQAFSRIAPEEIVRFTGTEPFWGGQVSFTRLTYSTPEDQQGTTIAVDRFAGRGGVSWSGTYRGAPFTLAVTPGRCSDGMSDRTYPYVVTLQVMGEQRSGCAWTERDPFVAPPGSE